MLITKTENAAFQDQTDVFTASGWYVAEKAEDRLRYSAYLELRNVFCSFRAGVLTLRGRVSSYYLKQLAQTLVGGIEDVVKVNNQMEVVQ